jgi:serine/threonine protein kinase
MDIARGLHFLHSNGVLHLDLKSANILLSRHNHAKIADVGMARLKAAAVVGKDLPFGACPLEKPSASLTLRGPLGRNLLGTRACLKCLSMSGALIYLSSLCCARHFAATGTTARC